MNYQKSKLNQLANARNPYQGDTPKALCVCSAGLLRSPSIAMFLTEKGYNTRAVGTAQDYALIPLSEALLVWADEIHVVNEELEVVEKAMAEVGLRHRGVTSKPVYAYNIPDEYETFDPWLMKLIQEQFDINLKRG